MRIFALALLVACPGQPPKLERIESALVGTFEVVHAMGYFEGRAPRGALTEVGGRLYGLAGEAGPNASGDESDQCQGNSHWNDENHLKLCPGSLFSVGLDGSDFRVDHAFTRLDATGKNVDGYHPYGTLSADAAGVLWGVTQQGGTSPGCASTTAGAGVLFSFDPVTSSFATEHELCSEAGAADGKHPMGAVAIDSQGRVFGTAKGNVNASNAQLVWRFDGASFAHSAPNATWFGWNGYGGLTYAGPHLVGMTAAGGANGRGAYFTVDPDTLDVTVVDAFPAYTASEFGTDNPPIGAPTVLSDGSVVTLRELGGAAGTGLVARLDGEIDVVHEFEPIPFTAVPRFSNTYGGMPNGRLVEGNDGMLYGTSMYGGAAGTGTIFRIARDGSQIQVLHSFPSSGPARPYGGLVLGSDGSFYGITFAVATLFRYTPPTEAAAFCGALE